MGHSCGVAQLGWCSAHHLFRLRPANQPPEFLATTIATGVPEPWGHWTGPRTPVRWPEDARYSSPENRSHADWRVIPRASPMRAQVLPRSLLSAHVRLTA